jgi:hypothetical protein
MGAKGTWTMGYNNDPDNFNKNGKQTQAYMRMIEQLKKPKDSNYDLTNMPNNLDMQTLVDNDFTIDGADPLLKWGDRLGVLLSQNGRGNFANYILP